MKRFVRLALFAIAAGAALLFPSALSAQGTLYTVSGTFPSNEPTSTYSAPNAPFTLTFLVPYTVPSNQQNDDIAPIHAGSYAFNGTNTALTGGTLREVATTAGNMVDLNLTTTSGLAFGVYGDGNSYLTPTGIRGALSLSVPGEGAVRLSGGSTSALSVNGAVVDVLGYYPAASVPLTQLSAPNAAFLVEYALPTPAAHPSLAFFLYGAVTYQGVTHPCDVSQSYYYHFQGFEAVVCATDVGRFELYSLSPRHFPVLYQASGATFTVPLGALGAGNGWALYSNVRPAPFSSAVALPQFIARRF